MGTPGCSLPRAESRSRVNSTTSMATVAINPSSLPTRQSRMQRLTRAARLNPLATVGTALVVFFVVLAVFAPLITPQDPAAIDLPTRLSRPSAAHWFGTDEL